MYKDLTEHWWLVLLRGLTGLFFGLVLLASPVKTAVVVTALVGLYLLIEGIVVAIQGLLSMKKNDKWWLVFLQGLLALLVGVAIFSWPGLTVQLLLFLFALWLVVIGILLVITAILVRKETEHEWLILGNGLVSLLLGILVINHTSATFALIALFVGIYAIIAGIMTTALAFKLRSLKKRDKKALSSG